jgi:hypothetical protein
LLDEVADGLRMRKRAILFVMRDVSKGIQTKGEGELRRLFGCSAE